MGRPAELLKVTAPIAYDPTTGTRFAFRSRLVTREVSSPIGTIKSSKDGAQFGAFQNTFEKSKARKPSPPISNFHGIANRRYLSLDVADRGASEVARHGASFRTRPAHEQS